MNKDDAASADYKKCEFASERNAKFEDEVDLL